ncbi:MAG: nucleoside hydrolase [Chloroflexi bacterium]|nr:nucleoside hydrolase [Chloroflexota bacterium]
MSVVRQTMVIDTDAGVDDAIALLMALAHPATQVVGITATHGNVDVDQVVANVGVVLDQMGLEVPIYRGADRPLVAEPLSSAHIHGEDGLGGIRATLPPTQHRPAAEHAAWALTRLAREHPGLTVLALGPLTNLALAVRLDPEFVRHVGRLVVMGGAIEARGNASPSAEYNIFADPEAAAIVFDAGFEDFWLLPWETTLKHPLRWDQYDALANLGTPRAAFFGRMTASLARLLREQLAAPGFLLPDPLAATVALEPEAAREHAFVPIGVETLGTYGRGLTSVDWRPQTAAAPNVHAVLTVDEPTLVTLLQRALQPSPSDNPP